MSAANIKMTTLDNGLRVVTDTVEAVQSVAVGIWAGVGARHEKAAVNGIAHLTEHMMFKGTEKYSAQAIAEEIENVGGHMNAYTSRDITSYHIHLLKDDAALALDVLADMYTASTFPEDELAKERHVVLQEIGMCHDTPDDLIFDHYFETAYADQAAGRPILGPASIVAEMPRQAIIDHVHNYYTVPNSVVVASGNIAHDDFVQMVQNKLGDMKAGEKALCDQARYAGGDRRTDKKDLEQTHLMLGFEAPSRLNEDYFAIRALAAMLGGGMSSRLFQEIREKRGLVYSIFAFYQGLQDSGQLAFYAGTGPKECAELIPVLCDEVMKITSTITEAELARTKAQLKSSLVMQQESMMSRADRIAKSVLFKDKLPNLEEALQKISALDIAAIQNIAKNIFASQPTFTALGPLQHVENYDAIKQRLVA